MSKIGVEGLDPILSLRELEVLAELEDEGGEITSPRIATDIKRRIGNTAYNASRYGQVIDGLVSTGLVSRLESDSETTLSVTDTGYGWIEWFKANPDMIFGKRGLSVGSIGFRLIEYVLREFTEVDEKGVHWLFSATAPINGAQKDVANALGAREDSTARTLLYLRNKEGYIVTKLRLAEDTGKPNIGNIGVTKSGKSFYDKVTEGQARRERLNDQARIDEVIQLASTGYHNPELREWLIKKSSPFDLTGMSQEQLDQRKAEIEEMLS